MNLKLFSLLVFLISSSQSALSQNVSEEEAVKKVIRFESGSYMKDDSVAWKDQFVQDDKTSMAFTRFGFAQNHIGWDNFAPMMIQWIKDFPSQYTDLQQSNHIINISNDLAWVAFDQLLSTSGADSIPARGSREFRTLIRDNDRWKISSIVSIDTASHISTQPKYMEYHFNFLGYRYLEDDMMDKALEVFKLNVKLYPKAWNPYDSLGEAYALMGEKDLAIENYRKSIELNPDNEHGKEMLKKLEEE